MKNSEILRLSPDHRGWFGILLNFKLLLLIFHYYIFLFSGDIYLLLNIPLSRFVFCETIWW